MVRILFVEETLERDHHRSLTLTSVFRTSYDGSFSIPMFSVQLALSRACLLGGLCSFSLSFQTMLLSTLHSLHLVTFLLVFLRAFSPPPSSSGPSPLTSEAFRVSPVFSLKFKPLLPSSRSHVRDVLCDLLSSSFLLSSAFSGPFPPKSIRSCLCLPSVLTLDAIDPHSSTNSQPSSALHSFSQTPSSLSRVSFVSFLMLFLCGLITLHRFIELCFVRVVFLFPQTSSPTTKEDEVQGD